MTHPPFFDNKASIVKDDLVSTIRSGDRVSVAAEVFSMYTVKHTNIICVTRNADLDATEGAEEQGAEAENGCAKGMVVGHRESFRVSGLR